MSADTQNLEALPVGADGNLNYIAASPQGTLITLILSTFHQFLYVACIGAVRAGRTAMVVFNPSHSPILSYVSSLPLLPIPSPLHPTHQHCCPLPHSFACPCHPLQSLSTISPTCCPSHHHICHHLYVNKITTPVGLHFNQASSTCAYVLENVERDIRT